MNRRAHVWAVVALLVLGLAGGATWILASRSNGDAHTSEDWTTEDVPCWGMVTFEQLQPLLRPGHYWETGGKVKFQFPSGQSDCQLTSGNTLLTFDIGARLVYLQGTARVGETSSNDGHVYTPFGGGLNGAVSLREAWVEVPPCRPGDASHLAELRVDDKRTVDLSAKLRPALVLLANAALDKGGCTEGRLNYAP
ncbi:hypothetical protein [Yinghuangia seranimata]|uniref:hypothetical protein n=1 Tax=Yinghuangia seranimata TaxID=408067 RepID=UPI00248C77D3|nr:hypothetical protein [Yinghuangia seranimata]MDI2132478.1 hypothetical protein [Yinghuangia seranimata]